MLNFGTKKSDLQNFGKCKGHKIKNINTKNGMVKDEQGLRPD